jgi:uncharacterized membrane protein HdeD (DUF308 family)
MNPTFQLALGVVLVVAGAVLALAFPDTEVFWFQGRPFGVVLAIVGAIDLAEAFSRRRRT